MMENLDYLRFIGALVLVIGLILALTWGVRRFGPLVLSGSAGAKRRLFVIETLTLDAKHRLVLVRKDERDHLLLLGGQALILESGGSGAAAMDGGRE